MAQNYYSNKAKHCKEERADHDERVGRHLLDPSCLSTQYNLLLAPTPDCAVHQFYTLARRRAERLGGLRNREPLGGLAAQPCQRLD
jgi:hypothetical protein